MEILFIGGSRFVGKHAVLEALRRGHEVTLFNRGSHPVPAQGVRHIRGDRDRDLARLEGERFDAVVDTSGYRPGQVRSAAQALAGRAGSYLFVSTISVYASQTEPHQSEDSPLVELDESAGEEVGAENYGGLKVLCERALEASFPDRKLIIRPGIIVGPDDPTDRFTYWPVRVGQGGEVLAPDRPEHPVQFIDARDLAAWMIAMLETEQEGTFNAVSQPDRFTMGSLIEASKKAAGASTSVTWVSEEFLLDEEVHPFADLPLWLPGESANFARVSAERAYGKGLSIRGLEDTTAATLRWYREQGEPKLSVGLGRDRERRLLAKWHELQK